MHAGFEPSVVEEEEFELGHCVGGGGGGGGGGGREEQREERRGRHVGGDCATATLAAPACRASRRRLATPTAVSAAGGDELSRAMDAADDLASLARDLRAERLFAQAELEWVRRLNEKLERAQADLAQASWTQLQQRSLAERLLRAGAGAGGCGDERPRCGKPSFVEAHKALRYQDALALASLAQCVRDSPAVASLWLAAAERAGPRALREAARALAGGLLVRDPRRLRRVLVFLARRRRARSPCFARLYAELVDGFRPARPFLAAALGPPVLRLLRSDPDSERAPAALTERFAASLREMWPCFPASVARVLRQTAAALEADPNVSTEEAHAVCSSLLFARFLCRAVADPEAYGVTDAPVAASDRLDLGRAAAALHALCLMKHREPDDDARRLCSGFDKDCVYPLLDALLEDPRFAPSQDDADSDDDDDSEEDAVETEPRFRPDVALLTRSDVRSLVNFYFVVSHTELRHINVIT